MALPLFAITLFVSAFLLFLVQPMIGKMILPKLGGTPQVWNTCCVFFQTVLLLGYFYTHATTHYLKPRLQMILHGLLLLIPLAVLLIRGPFSVAGWDPPEGTNPIWSTLTILAIVVGVPFFVVSTSAPLLQKWFSFSGDPTADDPYFLYGASNLGSLLSLLMYPFFVEPAAYLSTQASIWTGGYFLLVVLILAAAAFVWKSANSSVLEAQAPANPVPDPLPAITATPEASKTAIQPSRLVGKRKGLKPGLGTRPMTSAPSIARDDAYNPQDAPVDWLRIVRWILLAAIPSSLMLGVTTYISTDLSPFPFIWIIPLSLYLLSFILVFSKWPVPWTEMPHQMFLYGLPIAIIVMCVVIFTHDYSPGFAMWIQFIAFFWITMALHGELAKDRPAPRHLTLFFLCMSVGGMLGGVFNAIFAPIVFTGVYEYPLAIFAACLMRPNFAPAGWLDGLMLQNPSFRDSARESSDSFSKSFGRTPTGEPYLISYALDIGIGLMIALLTWVVVSNAEVVATPFVEFVKFLGPSEEFIRQRYSVLYTIGTYLLPIIACLIVLPRSLRFAIGVGAMLMFGASGNEPNTPRRTLLYAGRSYFGVLRVYRETENARGAKYVELQNLRDDKDLDLENLPHTHLRHGSTHHGLNYQVPELSRLATTYYHRFGPVGAITERYNWLPGPQNTYWSDLRGPATMIGLGAVQIGGMPLPQIVNCWSEPPYATVGLGTGTMASYSRWLQHMTYYEIDEKIRDMNRPPLGADGKPVRPPYFTYVQQAGERGAFIEIVMGDARQSLDREDRHYDEWKKDPVLSKTMPTPKRDHYYKFLNLDAFSSDAIPVHLISKEAIQRYMDKLDYDGVLMVHTSNRHMRLPEPVADICNELKLDAYLGHDAGGRETRQGVAGRAHSLGHFSSEYVMVARKGVLTKEKLTNAVKKWNGETTSITEWMRAPIPGREVWTDHYQDIRSILR